MNLKERGITVGDILIFTILVISVFLIFNRMKENDKKSFLNKNNIEFNINYISQS